MAELNVVRELKFDSISSIDFYLERLRSFGYDFEFYKKLSDKNCLIIELTSFNPDVVLKFVDTRIEKYEKLILEYLTDGRSGWIVDSFRQEVSKMNWYKYDVLNP